MFSMSRLKKETTHPGGNEPANVWFLYSVYMCSADQSALVIVTQIVPAKSDLSSNFGQDETYVHLCTGHTSLPRMSSKDIKVQITDCFICTLSTWFDVIVSIRADVL
jgi:hypothetical protein